MKKLVALVLSVVMIAAMVTGCSSTAQQETQAPTTAAAQEVKATEAAPVETEAEVPQEEIPEEIVWITLSDFVPTLEPIVARYKELTGVNVKLEGYASQDLTEVIEVKIGTGNEDYDVISVDGPLVSSYAYRGMVAPLDEYWVADEFDQITEVSKGAGSWQGVFYCPPMNTSSCVLFYNKKMLEDSGVELPADISCTNRLSFEQIADMCRQIKGKLDPNGTNGVYGLDYRQVSRTYQMNELPNSMGGKNIGDDGFTAEGVINSDEWVKACTWYQDCVNEGISSRGINASETRNLFISDKIAFMFDTTSLPAYCEKNGMDYWGVLPAPYFEGYEDKVATPTGSWHFGVNKDSRYKKAASDFIKWMTIGEGADRWFEDYNILPTKKTLLDRIDSDPSVGLELKYAVYESANTAVARALTPGFNEYNTIIANAWEDIRNGEDVKEVLDGAAADIEKVLNKFR